MGRLASLLVRTRLRSSLNAVRARPLGAPLALVVFGLSSAAAYAGLFTVALGAIAARGGPPAEGAALTLMMGAVALASLAARSSGEGLFAGSPENEFLLARPVSLARLVAARTLVALVSDPLGTLFLLPLLMAAAIAWQLPAPVWLVALATTTLAQSSITAAAQAIQVAVVRWVPRRRRTTLFVLLRLAAAITMAAAWVAATWVLRAPAAVSRHLDHLRGWLALTPSGLLTAPILAYRQSGGRAAALALWPLAAVACGAGALAVGVARWAGLRGWEEAGAPWAESSASARAPAGPPLTLVRREWRQLRRDRPRLVGLVAVPVLLFGVQLVGSVGWTLTTASVGRVAMLALSVTVYVGALGPLGHMQHERRAFWILRAAPVSVSRVMAAKARAWAVLLVGTALTLFVPLGFAIPGASLVEVLGAGTLVVLGALVATALAVAMGGVAADLSDDARPAVGPGTVYLFLFVGGLFNVVLQAHGWERARLVVLYGAAAVALWRAGVAQVEGCLDPETRSAPRPRLGDAAILTLIFAAAPTAIARGLARVDVPAGPVAVVDVAIILALGLVALALSSPPRSRRHPDASSRGPGAGPSAMSRAKRAARDGARAVAIGLGAAGLGGGVLAVVPGIGGLTGVGESHPSVLALAALVACAEELVWRGVVQGALERELAGTSRRLRAARWVAAAGALAVMTLATRQVAWPSVLLAVGPAVARAASGRVVGAVAARLATLVMLAYL